MIGLFALPAPADGGDGVGDERQAYRLGAGDRVKVVVFGEADLSGVFEVDGSGVVSFPLIGEVDAAGRTLRELEDRLETRLLDGYLKEPRVSAEVARYRPFYIIGEVNRPGSYAYVYGMKVINAVAMGGGFTHRAQKSRILITRAADPERRKRQVSHNDAVQPGDVITVPERYF